MRKGEKKLCALNVFCCFVRQQLLVASVVRSLISISSPSERESDAYPLSIFHLSFRDERLPLYEALKDESMEGVSMESVVLSCINLIQAVEEEKLVPDMNLLSKLCIVRDELLQVYEYGESEGDGPPLKNPFLSFKSVPQKDAAIVKELINVSSKAKRVAIIKSKLVNLDGSEGEIRPGRFLDCILALRQEMMYDEQGRTNTQVQNRLDDIREETVHVLEEISGEVPLRP